MDGKTKRPLSMDAVIAVESSSTVIYSKFEKVNMTRYGRGGNRKRTDDIDFDSVFLSIV